jgi:hypothetical protein
MQIDCTSTFMGIVSDYPQAHPCTETKLSYKQSETVCESVFESPCELGIFLTTCLRRVPLLDRFPGCLLELFRDGLLDLLLDSFLDQRVLLTQN